MERNSQEDIKAHLMETSPEFRKLVDEHQKYDRMVGELEAKAYLSQQEEIEEHRLKKLKLRLKDEMLNMLSQHKTENVA